MSQAIRLRVRSHDVYELELKIDYSLLPDRKTRHTVDMYVFIPHSLDINRRSYSQSDFYRDAKHYIRLRTPRLSLDSLATASSSPLAVCEQIVQRPDWRHDHQQQQRLENSIKVIRPVLNASLRAHVRRIASGTLTPDAARGPHAQVNRTVQELLAKTQHIIGRYRALEVYIDPQHTPNTDAIYRLTDDAISLVVQDALVQTYRILAEYPDRRVASRLQEQIVDQNQQEQTYRRRQNYCTLGADQSRTEAFLHQASLLKKFTLGALFLTISVSREGTTTEHVLYAMSAGVSMIFATIVAFYFQIKFGMLTFPFFVALVVGYMFKDRIKEIGRVLFAGYARRYFYDQRTVLRTSDGEHRLGHVREKVNFVTQDNLPAAVLEQRHQHLPPGMHSSALEEDVLHYSKQIVIDNHALDQVDIGGLELTGIRDIMRYNLRPYLDHMAAPRTLKHYLDAGKLHAISSHKTYRLYFIIQCRSSGGDGPVRVHTMVVHMNRNGIVSVKPG